MAVNTKKMTRTLEKIIVLLTDFVTINLAFIIFFKLRVESGWFRLLITPEFFIPMLIIYFYWVIIFMFVGMYRTWFAASRFDEISTLFKASFFGIFILFILIFIDDYLHGVASANRILIFIYWGLFILLVGGGRLIIRSVQRNLLVKGVGRKNAIIIGFNKKAVEVGKQLEEHRALGLDAVGYLSVRDTNIGKQENGITVIDSIHNIENIIDENNVKEVIIALERENNDVLIEIIGKCEPKNVGLKIVPDLYEILSGQARTSQIYGIPLIDIMPQLMPEWEKRLKRVLDVLFSFLILVVSFPVIIISAAAIKLDSKGPVFFTQERCGMDGEPFRMIKFRSMFVDAEKRTGPVWSVKDDPRITRVGKVIRKLRIDEIPQMVNVLKGEMSMVGPRPERPYFR